jgi:hypothetical protein
MIFAFCGRRERRQLELEAIGMWTTSECIGCTGEAGLLDPEEEKEPLLQAGFVRSTATGAKQE